MSMNRLVVSTKRSYWQRTNCIPSNLVIVMNRIIITMNGFILPKVPGSSDIVSKLDDVSKPDPRL